MRPLLNSFARVPVCGLITHLNERPDAARNSGDRLTRTMLDVSVKSLTVQGFVQLHYPEQWPDFYREATEWFAAGRLRCREDVVEGLENAPKAFIGLLEGRNFGKLVVKIGAADVVR